jgi:hypothetical protein
MMNFNNFRILRPIFGCWIIFGSILGPGFKEPLQAAIFTVTKVTDSADGHCDAAYTINNF